MEGLDDLKCELRCLINSTSNRLTVRDLQEDYEKMNSNAVPFRKYGFNSFYEFLRSIPESIRLTCPSDRNSFVEAVHNSKVDHLVVFMKNQKKQSNRKRPGCGREFYRPPPRHSYNHRPPPFRARQQVNPPIRRPFMQASAPSSYAQTSMSHSNVQTSTQWSYVPPSMQQSHTQASMSRSPDRSQENVYLSPVMREDLIGIVGRYKNGLRLERFEEEVAKLSFAYGTNVTHGMVLNLMSETFRTEYGVVSLASRSADEDNQKHVPSLLELNITPPVGFYDRKTGGETKLGCKSENTTEDTRNTDRPKYGGQRICWSSNESLDNYDKSAYTLKVIGEDEVPTSDDDSMFNCGSSVSTALIIDNQINGGCDYGRNSLPRGSNRAEVPNNDEIILISDDEKVYDLDEDGDKLKKNLFELLDENPNGIWVASLQTKYQEKFGYSLRPDLYGLANLKSLVARLEDVFCQRKYTHEGDILLLDARKINQEKPEAFVPRQLINEIIKLLKKKQYFFTDELENEYLVHYHKRLDFQEYGFDTLDELLAKLEGEVGYRQLQSRITMYLPVKNIDEVTSKVETPSEDCMTFNPFPTHVCDGSFILASERIDWEKGEKYRIKYCEVYGIDKFYFHLDENVPDLETMMVELNSFYSNYAADMKMLISAMNRNVFCVCKYAADGRYHRAQIKNVKSVQSVVVLYVDYGTLATVNKNELYYLHKSFATLPAQGIHARLAYIKPKNGQSKYDLDSTEFFYDILNMQEEVLAELEGFGKKLKVVIVNLYKKGTNGGYESLRDILINFKQADPSEILYQPDPDEIVQADPDATKNNNAVQVSKEKKKTKTTKDIIEEAKSKINHNVMDDINEIMNLSEEQLQERSFASLDDTDAILNSSTVDDTISRLTNLTVNDSVCSQNGWNNNLKSDSISSLTNNLKLETSMAALSGSSSNSVPTPTYPPPPGLPTPAHLSQTEYPSRLKSGTCQTSVQSSVAEPPPGLSTSVNLASTEFRNRILQPNLPNAVAEENGQYKYNNIAPNASSSQINSHSHLSQHVSQSNTPHYVSQVHHILPTPMMSPSSRPLIVPDSGMLPNVAPAPQNNINYCCHTAPQYNAMNGAHSATNIDFRVPPVHHNLPMSTHNLPLPAEQYALNHNMLPQNVPPRNHLPCHHSSAPQYNATRSPLSATSPEFYQQSTYLRNVQPFGSNPSLGHTLGGPYSVNYGSSTCSTQCQQQQTPLADQAQQLFQRLLNQGLTPDQIVSMLQST